MEWKLASMVRTRLLEQQVVRLKKDDCSTDQIVRENLSVREKSNPLENDRNLDWNKIRIPKDIGEPWPSAELHVVGLLANSCNTIKTNQENQLWKYHSPEQNFEASTGI